MEILLNERFFNIEEGMTAFGLRDAVKKDADIVVLNGFIIKKDAELKEGDSLSLIKKGEMPSQQELEALLVSRHTPGVHEKVKKAAVGIAGLGGLGSNIAVSLARMGIGRLLLADFDVVEPSNLNRQQYFIRHIGMRKTEAMREILAQINPFVTVDTRTVFIDGSNIVEIFGDMDIIVEAFDNPKSKVTLINTVMGKLPDKPVVAASGMAGYFSNNTIITRRMADNLYVAGDLTSEARPGCGLMAPRVAIAANHQANTVIRIILGEKEV